MIMEPKDLLFTVTIFGGLMVGLLLILLLLVSGDIFRNGRTRKRKRGDND